ncbi:protein SCO1/2 [Gracilibacillus ureilyticus]|uniref:Protein SCO1/2 n=1 Tax=Gracilibacillus ureilyticus TaxID=531814 RepID=A0A1H9TL61_9BACI|nr:SCO family protein [Gracilibacillus ureilyticus]SER98030.1 protein SCO1/2 [Gracilibacillus ureilyticus]
MKSKFLFVILMCSIILTACGTGADGDNASGSDADNNSTKYKGDFEIQVEDFIFTNQNGEEFSKELLDGKFWVANMVFTNCTTVCPAMTANMSRLQDLLIQEGIDAELVSFSVDPANDTPEKLKQYAEDRGATFENWNLLTGYSDEEIKQFALNSFKAFVENPENSDQVVHQTTFYLVTPDGFAIKGYNGSKADNMKKIVEDIKTMN